MLVLKLPSARSDLVPPIFPPLSKKALDPGSGLPRYFALEGRSILRHGLGALQLSLAQADRLLLSPEAHEGTGRGKSAHAVWRWARGEGAPLRSRVHFDGKYRCVADVLSAQAPEIREITGHPVWKGLDLGRPMSASVGLKLARQLPASCARVVLEDSGRHFRPAPLSPLRVYAALLQALGDEKQIADLLAALLIWARQVRLPSFPLDAETAYLSRGITDLEIVARRFARSSWVTPIDKDLVLEAAHRIFAHENIVRRLLTDFRNRATVADPN